MPQALLQLLDFCQREGANLGDLAAIVARDAGMAARIFALASAVAFHGRQPPATVEHCLQRLGMSMIKTVVINESVMQVCGAFAAGRDLDLRDFWRHSLRCALIARGLAAAMAYPSPEEAYLGGLLHDIGRLAMVAAAPDGYTQAFHTVADDERLCTFEQDAFALNHAEVGAWLVEKWQLDSFLGDSILYHHEPAERVVSAHPLIRIVLLAQRFSMLRGGEPSLSDLQQAQLCGAPEDRIGALVAAAEGELSALAEQLGIELGEARNVPVRLETGAAEMQIAARIRDIVLVERVLAEPSADCREAALRRIGQAAKILFDIDAALWFEPVDTRGERFRAKPLNGSPEHASQLEFLRGGGVSPLARAPDGVPLLLTPATSGAQVLERQLLRLLGGEAVWLLPLGSGRDCLGILAGAGPEPGGSATRMACLEYFCRAGAALLARAGKAGQAEAEASQGRLRAMIHEINNPLAIVRNYFHVLEKECAGNGTGRPELAIVRDEMERIGRIINAVRELGDAEAVPQMARLDLNRVLGDIVALCRQSGASAGAVDIRLDLAEDLPVVSSDADRLKQLLLNLLKNALEAMPGGGTIRIATAAWGSGSVPSHVEVWIEDDGPGMPKEILQRLYRPVPSTKGGEHQGLGLAIVGELVRELRGMINCRSSGQGTRFQLLLPGVAL